MVFTFDEEIQSQVFFSVHDTVRGINAKNEEFVKSIKITRGRDGQKVTYQNKETDTTVEYCKPSELNTQGRIDVLAMRTAMVNGSLIPVYALDRSGPMTRYFFRGNFVIRGENRDKFLLHRVADTTTTHVPTPVSPIIDCVSSPPSSASTSSVASHDVERDDLVVQVGTRLKQRRSQRIVYQSDDDDEEEGEVKAVERSSTNKRTKIDGHDHNHNHNHNHNLNQNPNAVTRSYRSLLEARFAAFLSTLKVQFLYEHVTFALNDGKSYTPDFFLPQYNMFIELKPCYPHVEEIDKCRQIASTGFNIILLFGNEFVPPLQRIDSPLTFNQSNTCVNSGRHYSHQNALRGMCWNTAGERMPGDYMWIESSPGTFTLSAVDDTNANLCSTPLLLQAYRTAHTYHSY